MPPRFVFCLPRQYSFVSVPSRTATVSTDGKTAGTFRVTPNAVFKTGLKDWNEYYELSFVQGTLTVNPAVSVIDTVLPTIIAGNGCANGYANCACESFYDLDASRWYHEAIDWAYSLGLMNGTTKSTLSPSRSWSVCCATRSAW